jgi:sterol desaturase/sphingolipid hydroxylase (fatty acid hydroxylase superfamily)
MTAAIRSDSSPRPLTGLRWLVAWTIFPVVLGLSLFACVIALRGGASPGWAVLAISLIAGAVLLVVERLQPHARYWLQPQRDVATDVTHAVLSSLLVPAIFEAAVASLLLAGAVWLSTLAGVSLWPAGWPLAVQLVLALLVAELGQYWWHRLAHRHDALWRFHATHHSSRRLYWLNSCRFHPVDSMAQYTLEAAPLVLLGCPAEVLALFTLSTAVIGMFQHANVELRCGVLNWIFSLTELHRWHHSRELREGNSNYGANLIIWDVIFGTRFLPAGRELAAENVGLAGMPQFPRTYWGQIASPFRWQALREKTTRRRDELEPARHAAPAEQMAAATLSRRSA